MHCKQGAYCEELMRLLLYIMRLIQPGVKAWQVFRLILIPAMAVSLFQLIGCSEGSGNRTNDSGAGKNPGIPVECLLIRTQTLDNSIYTTGTLLANEEVELRAEISGRVAGVYFEEGKKVRKGDLLLKINDRELRAQLKRKEVEEKQASDEEGRKRKLIDNQSISQEEYDKALNTLRMIQADKEAIESRLAETEIRAPFDGIIGLRYISDGGYVTPSVLIASMQDVNTMKVEFSASEKHVGQIGNGTEVMVRVGELTNSYRGTVYAVESKIDAGTRTIKARARIPNADGPLIPGSFAKVEITLERIPDAIVVPSGAVIPDISGESVYLCRGGKAKLVSVKTGIRTESGTQITQGLAANDTLIVSGLLQLTDGKSVQIKALPSD
jgi:membrane fusion protein (multidrug efflux system)